jgi:hypothetical protein
MSKQFIGSFLESEFMVYHSAKQKKKSLWFIITLVVKVRVYSYWMYLEPIVKMIELGWTIE